MTLTERPPVEALDAGVIEDARARQRRHRGIAATVTVAAAGIAALVLGFADGGGSRAAPGSVHHGRPAPKSSQATLTACVSPGRSRSGRRPPVLTPLSILSVLGTPPTMLPALDGPQARLSRYHLARTVSGVDLYVYTAGSPQCSTSRIFLIDAVPGSRGYGGGGGLTAATIGQGGLLGGFGGPTGPEFIDGLVPNGIATVTLYYPARSPIRMRVINNVFAAAFPRATFPPRTFGQPAREVWRSANGTVIRTFHTL